MHGNLGENMKHIFFNLLLGSLIIVDVFSMRSIESGVSSNDNVKTFNITERYLDNGDCKNGVTFRPWEEAFRLAKKSTAITANGNRDFIKFIVWHYTAGSSVDSTYGAYNDAGVSAHYTISNNGEIYLSVEPDRYIAFHAGRSAFGGYENLNLYSIGIEHVNPGNREASVNFSQYGFGLPEQLKGDQRWWYSFSEEQLESSCELTQYLQKKYKIPGWNVVTHADIAIGRKSDIGPLWNYKKAFEDYNVGYWHTESHLIAPNIIDNFKDEDYIHMIEAIGYTSENKKQLVKAYKMHYMCSEISDELTDETKKVILKHVIGLKDYVYQGKKYEYFEGKMQEFFKNDSRFSEYF